MKIELNDKVREFMPIPDMTLKDMGNVRLEDEEQLTFVTQSGKTNDIVKKDWGFYLGNSINWNLKHQGFKTALVESCFSGERRLYINLVEVDMISSFEEYIRKYNAKVISWLDEA